MLTLPLDGHRLLRTENWSCRRAWSSRASATEWNRPLPFSVRASDWFPGNLLFRKRGNRPTLLAISSVNSHLLHPIKWRNWRLLFGAWQNAYVSTDSLLLFSFTDWLFAFLSLLLAPPFWFFYLSFSLLFLILCTWLILPLNLYKNTTVEFRYLKKNA